MATKIYKRAENGKYIEVSKDEKAQNPYDNYLMIRSNNKPREIIYGWQLTEDEAKEFDYYEYNPDDENCELFTAAFFRYRGDLYDLHEFMPCPKGMFPGNWEGYHSYGYDAGLVMRYTDDYEAVIVGYYY